jgi:hypothetical protein
MQEARCLVAWLGIEDDVIVWMFPICLPNRGKLMQDELACRRPVTLKTVALLVPRWCPSSLLLRRTIISACYHGACTPIFNALFVVVSWGSWKNTSSGCCGSDPITLETHVSSDAAGKPSLPRRCFKQEDNPSCLPRFW